MVVNNVFCLDKYKPEKNIRFGVFCKFWKKIKVQWGGEFREVPESSSQELLKVASVTEAFYLGPRVLHPGVRNYLF